MPIMPTPTTEFQCLVNSQLSACIKVYQVQLSMYWPDFLVGEDRLFEMLNKECDLDFFWDHFEDPSEEQLNVIAQGFFQFSLDVQKAYTTNPMNELKSNGLLHKASFEYITNYVLGRAFRAYLKEKLSETLDAMQHNAISEHVPFTSVEMFNFITSQMAE